MHCLGAQAQHIFYQDTFYGGITGAGINTGAESDTGNFVVYIEPGSSIKKAFLISSADGSPEGLTISLNSINYTFNSSNSITSGFLSWYGAAPSSMVNLIDVTLDIDSQVTNYEILVPPQQPLSQELWQPFYLLILYENSLLPKVNASIILNDMDVGFTMSYLLANQNPISTLDQVGFAFVGKHFCDTITDGSFVSVNGNTLGLVGGEDAASAEWFCSGTQGHFYYQNDSLFGLDDDSPDSLMGGPDALANIQSYLANNTTSLQIDWQYQTPPANSDGARSNPIVAAFLAYTTPCDTFTATVTPDTTTCIGKGVQLQATGGQAYEWEPAYALSCTNCPNPIASPDSTVTYTVRIWNTDSCSKVLPVRVYVKDSLQSGFTIADSECEVPTGEVAFSPPTGGSVPFTYTLDGVTQPTPLFDSLAAGSYPALITDAFGCTWQDTAYVDTYVVANAAFSANPSTGNTPLNVQFTNQSAGAQNYLWITGNDTASTQDYSYTFTQQGSNPVMLIVWNTDSTCADTATQTIIAETNLELVIPTLYSASDGPYTLQVWGATAMQVQWFDRSGRKVIDTEIKEPGTAVTLGDAIHLATGLYLYRITATGFEGEVQAFEGKVVVSR